MRKDWKELTEGDKNFGRGIVEWLKREAELGVFYTPDNRKEDSEYYIETHYPGGNELSHTDNPSIVWFRNDVDDIYEAHKAMQEVLKAINKDNDIRPWDEYGGILVAKNTDDEIDEAVVVMPLSTFEELFSATASLYRGIGKGYSDFQYGRRALDN